MHRAVRSRAPLGPFPTRRGALPAAPARSHRVTSGNSALDNVAVVRGTRHDGDVPTEAIELCDTFRAADTDDLVALIQRVLDHVLAELSRSPDDAHLNLCAPLTTKSGVTAREPAPPSVEVR